MSGGPAVLVTRPAGDADRLAELLATAGWRPVAIPTVATEPVAPGILARAVERLATFDWVAVTSATAVDALAGAAALVGTMLPADPPRWAAVGPATAAALRASGVSEVLLPGRSRGAAIAEALLAVGSLAGRRILLPRADAADPELPQRLRAVGAVVEELVAYRTVEGPPASRAALLDALADPTLAAVTVASGSAARGLVRLTAGDPRAAGRLAALPLVSIGPATSVVVRGLGLAVAAEAAAPTAEALAAAVGSLPTLTAAMESHR